ncbi:MAG: LLM class flavin-dependent oxidoreductase, partial [Halolamina sp.]
MVSHGLLLPTRLSVMSTDDPATLAAKTDSQIVGLAERAESLGFDSVWVGDSVLAKPRHEPLTTLAAIAGATESVELGTAVYLPNLRDPVNIAHLTATVDQLSGGRLLLGVGTGSTGKLGSSVEHEYEEMDIPWEDRQALLDEQLDVITGLWSGEPLHYDGEFHQYDGASIGF